MPQFTKTIGIIAEGPTDHRVLRNILVGFFDDPDFTQYIRPLQPALDDTDAGNLGGWSRVLDYIQSEDFRDATSELDFLLVSVDTDRLDEEPFKLNKLDENGRTATPEAFVSRTKSRFAEIISEKFGSEFFSENSAKMIFGIAVNEIECWLLPLFSNTKTKAATTQCLSKLDDQLRKQNLPPAVKTASRYDALSKGFKKRKTLLDCHDKNPSLKLFFEEISAKIGVLPQN